MGIRRTASSAAASFVGAAALFAVFGCSPTVDETSSGNSSSSSSGTGGSAPLAKPTTIVDRRSQVLGFAVGANQVFWEDELFKGTAKDPSVVNGIDGCPLTGCTAATPPLELVAQDEAAGTLEQWLPVIAIDDANVYGVDASSGAGVIGKCPPSSGCSGNIEPLVVVPLYTVLAFAVADDTLYYFTSQGTPSHEVGSCPTKGAGCGSGHGTLVEYDDAADDSLPAGFAVSNGTIYWASKTGTKSCPTSGCTKPKVLTTSPAFDGFAVDGPLFYWTDDHGSLMVCPVAGCEGEPKLVRSKVFSFAVDHEVLYFVTSTPNDGFELMSCSASACEATSAVFAKVDLALGSAPVELRLDGGHVYFASANDGAILRFDRTR